ncbi:ras-related protein Rab-44 isoform 4-T5 [Sarcophilus harrisii]
MESSNPRAGRKSRKLGSRRRHQMKEVADEDGPPALDSEWPSQATEELQDFFRECGAEQKGFITREDLRKAKFSFLGNPEELELIFEWLDPERKGSLTIKEFTSGLKNVFSSQTRIPGSRKKKPRTWVFSKEEPTSFQRLEEVDPEERRWFLSFMEQLGTDHLSLDQAEIWQLWKKLRQEEPHLVGNLEGFLAKVTSRLRETQAEKETLQMTLKKYDDDHHREVQQLYEEMEHQIHSEKQRLQAASDTQGLAYSSMMHQALEAKEQEMQYLAEGQRELEAQIDLLKSKRHEVSLENQRLQETQRDLTGQLEQVQGQLQVTRGHLNLARGQVAWQVEEETSLSSDPPVDPKNTSDSQHFTSFPEEDPLPSLFEEGDWSQLLSNFTSPLSGNTTQISWSPPPTPTSLKGYHTPRIVRQISITKRNSWQFNQESPSDPEVLPRSPLGSSEAPAVVLELKVAGEPKPGKTFQLDFQRVSSGEPAITTWGQAAPELGDSLASSDSLPSQELAGPGQEAGVPELDVGNAPDQETRFMPSCETHVSGACEEEAEILHSPGPDEEDSPGQEEVQLPKSSGPRVGDAPEKEPGNVESPRPDVLPVVPERGGLQDQNSEAVWRAEDGVLQRQAREGFWLPKDSPGDTLGTQDAGQALSVPLEAEAQPECKVLGGQIIPLSEPREENSLEVMKKANLKSQVQATRVSPGGEAPEPDYLFHVLFLGDSNVGKTSFLHLLHHDSFATGLTATVGMDYRIKNLMVDNRWFALQLWDTAGQERYHSITKQFLRKADGIVLMYDVTCPGSFTHVRYWLDCIQERGPDDVVILLLGNKIDCVKERLVSTEAGQLLAKEIGVIFGECSAVLGHNILEPIMSLARAMQEQDTKMKHSVVKLEKKEVKKAGCCS